MDGSRRALIGYLALTGASVYAGAGAMRGLRIPPILDPRAAPRTAHHSDSNFSASAEGAFFQQVDGDALTWRAFEPEPILKIKGTFHLRLDNIHPGATLEVSGPGRVSGERIENLRRTVTGDTGANTLTLRWHFPQQTTYRFSVIGDTGGGRELAWTLERSQQLGMHFMLLLGDIYYQSGDYQRAVTALNHSPLPVYATIGNHDLRNGPDWFLADQFIAHIGPTNSTFKLGGIQFVNLDTAADTIPWSGGGRGRLLRALPALADNPGIRDYVVFTHRPITDPRAVTDRPNDHSIENFGEDGWLYRQLVSRGVRSILNGHIHKTIEFEDRQLRTYIAGEGLAHLDLVGGKQVARILVGEVAAGELVAYHWEPMNMPFEFHCSQRLRQDMAEYGDHFSEALAKLNIHCASSI